MIYRITRARLGTLPVVTARFDCLIAGESKGPYQEYGSK